MDAVKKIEDTCEVLRIQDVFLKIHEKDIKKEY